MKTFRRFFLAFFLSVSMFMGGIAAPESVSAKTPKIGEDINLIVLSAYSKTISIGEEFRLLAVATNLKMPTFKSSNSAVASVDTYGLVTGKKAGSCKITAKVTGGEASCKVTVQKPTMKLSKSTASMENGTQLQLTATISTGSDIVWKSSAAAVAEVDETGLVTAKKCGTATITAKADGVSKSCKVTVKKPTLSLDRAEVTLYRNQTVRLKLKSSNRSEAVWKSSKNAVAMVDETGTVTAVAHGSAVITVKVDGVSKSCKVTVRQPDITLSREELTLSVGEKTKLKAVVSSGNPVVWSSSNDTIVSVDSSGNVKARQKGKAYIYAKEDGVKKSCIVQVVG